MRKKYIFRFFCTNIVYTETPRPYTNRHVHTQMFALCGNRTRNLLRSRRVFPPLRQIGRQLLNYLKYPPDLGLSLIKDAILYTFPRVTTY
jgi:hypothetical protein